MKRAFSHNSSSAAAKAHFASWLLQKWIDMSMIWVLYDCKIQINPVNYSLSTANNTDDYSQNWCGDKSHFVSPFIAACRGYSGRPVKSDTNYYFKGSFSWKVAVWRTLYLINPRCRFLFLKEYILDFMFIQSKCLMILSDHPAHPMIPYWTLD